MESFDLIISAAAFAIVAALYSTVGHGGASGYLAVMGLMGFPAAVMRPTALIMNLVVAGIGTVRFKKAGAFEGRLFWPFIVTSVPCAYVGGAWPVGEGAYKQLVGVVLVLAALRLVLKFSRDASEVSKPVPLFAGLIWGAVIGILSGLVGVGGGIFLSPLLLLMRWSTAKQAAAVSAPFIVVNSLAGLIGQLAAGGGTLPINLSHVAIFAAATLVGGWIGSGLGSKHLGHIALRRALAVVVFSAGIKMMLPKSTKPPAVPPTTQHQQ